MILRRLKGKGVERFGAFLDSLTTDEPQSVPEYLLDDPGASEELASDVEVEKRSFTNRSDAAKYLNGLLGDAGIPDIERDRGLWAWLSLFYFDQLCPVGRDGKRKPGERARWIPALGNFRKYYRHLLAGPFRIYRAHRENPDRALALLCNPLNRPGDVAEQLASRQELVTNAAVMEAATKLYVNPVTKRLKRGAAGKGEGSARRLADIVNQFDVTWDLYSMDTDAFLAILPAEFSRFKVDIGPN